MQHTQMKILTAVLILLATGCQNTQKQESNDTVVPTGEPKINHIVLIKLRDRAQSPSLIRDSVMYLEPIPGVDGFFVGPHFDIGRNDINSDYDVGLRVGFDSSEIYQQYLDHENHTRLLEIWKPRIQKITIYDILDVSDNEG